MIVEVSNLEDFHRSEHKRRIEESLIIFVRRVMLVEVSEWEHLHRSEHKKWTEEWFIMFVKHVMIVEGEWVKIFASK